MGDKVHTLFIEAVAIGYTVESKFSIESFPEVTKMIARYLEQFGQRMIYDDTDAESWANSAVGFHILRTQEKLGLDPNDGISKFCQTISDASEETRGECLLDGRVSKSPATNEKAHDELPGDNLLAQRLSVNLI